jgi:ABC-2 type transport system permease protein
MIKWLGPIIHELRVLLHLVTLSVRRLATNRLAMLSGTFGMLMNNFLFFMIWVIIFHHVGNLRGWTLEDMALMYGMGATSFGLACAIFGGFRLLTDDIDTGRFDTYMARPASPMTMAVTSNSVSHSWGDFLTGPLFWLIFCNLTLVQWGLMVLMVLIAALVCTAVGVIIYSIGFWFNDTRNHADTFLYFALGFITMPLHGLPDWIKLVIFTILPVAYIAYVPVEIIRDPSPVWLGLFLVGAIWSLLLARFVFYRGLRRYKGSSGALRTGN